MEGGMARAATARNQEPAKSDHNREQVTSVERALSILELLASRNHGLSTSEISRVAKVPKSSTSYLLRTLVSRGYVRRDVETGQHGGAGGNGKWSQASVSGRGRRFR